MKDFTITALSQTVGQVSQTRETVGAWAGRLATWLVVGNAGALVLALQVLREAPGSPVAELAFESGRFFGVGLVLAFVGASLGYSSLIWTSRLQTSAVDIAYTYAHAAAAEDWHRQRGTPLPSSVLDAQAAEMQTQAATLKGLETRMRTGPNRLAIVSLATYGVSAFLFMAGMTKPLIYLQPGGAGLTVSELVDVARLAQKSAASGARPQTSPEE